MSNLSYLHQDVKDFLQPESITKLLFEVTYPASTNFQPLQEHQSRQLILPRFKDMLATLKKFYTYQASTKILPFQ